MEKISAFANKYLTIIHFPTRIVWTDVVEIIIISFLVYQILVWIRDTKAWNLLKGIIVIIIFLLFAAILDLSTILWIANKIFSVAVIAVVIVLQPELRRALEQLGQKSFLAGLMPFDLSKSESGRFSDRTLNELVKASFEMAKVKTGALIVIEQNHILTEYERTGIEIDAVVSNQLLININRQLLEAFRVYRSESFTDRDVYKNAIEPHEALLDCFRHHDYKRAVDEMRNHLNITTSDMEKIHNKNTSVTTEKL